MDGVVSRFESVRLSDGHLLTVKGDAQKIRDQFFIGRPTFLRCFKWQTYSVLFFKFPINICTVERCQVDPQNSEVSNKVIHLTLKRVGTHCRTCPFIVIKDSSD